MQALKVRHFTGTKTGFHFFIGLWLSGCFLLCSALCASGQLGRGIITPTSITLGGNNIVDSYDSANPSYSLWHSNWWFQGHNFGTYTNTFRTDQAFVGTDSSVITLNGGVIIYGFVDTGPGGGVVLKGNGNSVGDLAWIGPNPQSPANTGIESGHQLSNMNVVFSNVFVPTPTNSLYNYGTGWPSGRWLDPGYYSSGTNIGGVTYYYLVTNVPGLITSPGNRVFYAFFNITNHQESIFIDASNCVLFLTNGIRMISGDNLTLNVTNNANVEIYTGATFDVGNGSVNNVYQYAPTFKLYGLPACNSIVFPGNANLSAWIYAPEANVTFAGGGSNPYDIAGAFMVNSIALKSHFNFHCDQIFGTNLPAPPVLISQPSNQIVPLGSNATFTVSATGTAPLWYAWFSDQTNLLSSGTNSSSLSLTNVQLSDAGNYFVIVTNLYNSITSAPASLVVYTDATPTLNIDLGSTNGQFQLDVDGVTGLNYTVLASTNLVDWISLGTNVSPFIFADTNTALFPQRFYRSLFVP